MRRISSVVMILWCGAMVALHAETVTSVGVSGNVVRLTLGTNVCELTPINDWTVKVEYRPNNQVSKASEIIDSSLTSTLSFTSIDQSGDPIKLTGANYTVKVTKAPFSIEFMDNAGFSLYKTTTLTSNEVSGQVVSGNYYGFHNDQGSNLTVSGNRSIDPGRQGHGCSPFVWSPKKLGVLVDAEKGWFNLTGATLQVLRTGSTNKNSLFFLMTGSPRQMMQNYYRVTGFFPVPHLWAMGFMNSEWGLTEAEMLTHIRNYRSKDIPLDAFILDYDWFQYGDDNNGDFKWNTWGFPSAMSGALKKTCDSMGVRLVGIRKPHGNWGAKDFYNPVDQAWFWNSFVDPSYDSYARGIIAYWNDEADDGYPPFSFLYMQKSMFKGQRGYNNKRVWSINRNYMGGAHRYAYGLWSGDIGSDFGQFAAQRGFMLSSINLGTAWWGMDIGGFTGTPTNELYYRWMQTGAFVPIYRVHGTEGQQRQPWVYGTEAEGIARKFVQLRYSLIPYVYSAYWKLHLDGLPIARPLVMDYPDEAATATRTDCWMFGEAFHVTPVVSAGATSVKTYLPAGTWVDFWTDAITDGGREITVPVTKDKIPVYVKQGSIVPRRPWGAYAEDPSVKEINFHVYAGANGSFSYFEDDGWTYDYEKGTYCRIEYDHQSSGGQEKVTISRTVNGFTPVQKTGYFTFHGIAQPPASVLAQQGDLSAAFTSGDIAAAAAPAWTYNAATKQAVVKVTDPFAAGAIIVSATVVRAGVSRQSTTRLPGIRTRIEGDRLIVDLTSLQLPGASRIEVIDSRGRLAASTRTDLVPLAAIDASRLARGTYVVRVSSTGRGDCHARITIGSR